MHWSEVLVLVLVIAILGGYLAWWIVRRSSKKGFSTCECGKSHGLELVKAYHQANKKEGCCHGKGNQD